MAASERTGFVTAFDAARGLGDVTADDGTTFPFHCIEIADGTRTIDVGARVRFGTWGKLGRIEARGLRPA